MDIILIKQDTSEWDYIWLWLELHPINAGLEFPMVAENNGEVWQYTCSYRQKGKVVHEFRHRFHPVTNDVYVLNLSASETFNEKQIEKVVNKFGS